VTLSEDIRLTIDSAIGTFLALALTESLVKPVAQRTGRYILRKLDTQLKFIPNWLHSDAEKP
jgi:hypothetical protein